MSNRRGRVINQIQLRLLGGALLSLVTSAAAAPVAVEAQAVNHSSDLNFIVAEGQNLNSFVRADRIAAHLVLRSGTHPRILVAFPAGNSGVGVWFEPVTTAKWKLLKSTVAVTLHDAHGRPLYGISADVDIDARALTLERTLLSSVRVLRDYQAIGRVSPEVSVGPIVSTNRMRWARDRIDGKPGYELTITVVHGSVSGTRLIAGADGHIGLRILAATGEPPLTPVGGDALLNAAATSDPEARRILAFLSYREKFLAGSWRFDTYFGRDTLMSVRLLMPVLQPGSVENGLHSVVARLSPGGEVAHEEAIGEFAVLAHRAAGEPESDQPVLDYGMIDASYMLAPVAAAWLIDDARGALRAKTFLAGSSDRVDGIEETVGASLVRNLRLVVEQTRAFAAHPSAVNLLAIKPGRASGQWRDSDTGLGGGRYPYDVNAVFAPAALTAIDRMLMRGLLDPYLTKADRDALTGAGQAARVWHARAAGYFKVTEPAVGSRRDVEAYATALAVPVPSLPNEESGFYALSLKADGSPVPVINSDAAFDLLFGEPRADRLHTEIASMMRPFPAGLMTDIGLLVANPVHAPEGTKQLFTPAAYHGLVVWSWQQAVLAAGLNRQLLRTDLPAPLRGELMTARTRLWSAIEATRAVSNSELWSWRFAEGRYQVVPFGAGQRDVDESNAAQLWSTVFLALKPPSQR